MPREIVTFQCTECKNRNYTKTKNKKTTTERLEFNKICPHCHKHQAHRETKERGTLKVSYAELWRGLVAAFRQLGA